MKFRGATQRDVRTPRNFPPATCRHRELYAPKRPTALCAALVRSRSATCQWWNERPAEGYVEIQDTDSTKCRQGCGAAGGLGPRRRGCEPSSLLEVTPESRKRPLIPRRPPSSSAVPQRRRELMPTQKPALRPQRCLHRRQTRGRALTCSREGTLRYKETGVKP